MSSPRTNPEVVDIQKQIKEIQALRNILMQSYSELSARGGSARAERIKFASELAKLRIKNPVLYQSVLDAQSPEELRRITQTLNNMGLSDAANRISDEEYRRTTDKDKVQKTREGLEVIFNKEISRLKSVAYLLSESYADRTRPEQQRFMEEFHRLTSDQKGQVAASLSEADIKKLMENLVYPNAKAIEQAADSQKFIENRIDQILKSKDFSTLSSTDKETFLTMLTALPEAAQLAALNNQSSISKVELLKDKRLAKHEPVFANLQDEMSQETRNKLVMRQQFKDQNPSEQATFIQQFCTLKDADKILVLNSQFKESREALRDAMKKQGLKDQVKWMNTVYKKSASGMNKITKHLMDLNKYIPTEDFAKSYLRLDPEHKLKVLKFRGVNLATQLQRHFNQLRGTANGTKEFGRDADRLIRDTFLPQDEQEKLMKLDIKKLNHADQIQAIKHLTKQLENNDLPAKLRKDFTAKLTSLGESFTQGFRQRPQQSFHQLSHEEKAAFLQIYTFTTKPKQRELLLAQQNPKDMQEIVKGLSELQNDPMQRRDDYLYARDDVQQRQSQKASVKTQPGMWKRAVPDDSEFRRREERVGVNNPGKRR